MDSLPRNDPDVFTAVEQPGADTGSRAQPAGGLAQRPRRLNSDEVFAGAAEVLIRHGSVDYRLRRTSLGKLILTK